MANKPYPLKRSSSFRGVALKGKKRRLSAWITIQLGPSQDLNNYYGVTASRKVGNAVVRNKLKRWVRNCVQNEAWPEKYNAHTIVFVFKPQAEDKFFSNKKYSDFLEIFRKI
ncbi:MAG: ribonuclease P protein component [Bdellovibrionota bacterium]